MEKSKLEGRQEASFIYIQGLNYHEKIITYESWIDDVEIIGVKNIQYNAHNVSNALSRAMKKEMGIKISHILDDRPFHIERIAFDHSNATKQLTIVGKNSLIVKNGSFGEERILRKVIRNSNQNREMLFNHDLSRNPMYQSIMDVFVKMMDGTINQEILRAVCSVVPQDVYLELLCVLNGLVDMNSFPSKFYEESKEKVKSLLEYSK